MIITEEWLVATEACQQGIDDAKALNIIGLPKDQFIQALIDNGFKTHAAWMRWAVRSAKHIRHLGDFTMGRFMVFNPMTGQYEYADTKKDAKALLKTISDAYIAANVMPMFDVQQEITDNGSGIVAWEKTDLAKV